MSCFFFFCASCFIERSTKHALRASCYGLATLLRRLPRRPRKAEQIPVRGISPGDEVAGVASPTRRSESLLSRRRVWVYSSMMKFPYDFRFRFLFLSSCVIGHTPSVFAWNWVRNIDPPLPCRKHCRAE